MAERWLERGASTTSNPVFGVLGGALVVLVWLYLLSAALLFGAELNAVLTEGGEGAATKPVPPPSVVAGRQPVRSGRCSSSTRSARDSRK